MSPRARDDVTRCVVVDAALEDAGEGRDCVGIAELAQSADCGRTLGVAGGECDFGQAVVGELAPSAAERLDRVIPISRDAALLEAEKKAHGGVGADSADCLEGRAWDAGATVASQLGKGVDGIVGADKTKALAEERNARCRFCRAQLSDELGFREAKARGRGAQLAKSDGTRHWHRRAFGTRDLAGFVAMLRLRPAHEERNDDRAEREREELVAGGLGIVFAHCDRYEREPKAVYFADCGRNSDDPCEPQALTQRVVLRDCDVFESRLLGRANNPLALAGSLNVGGLRHPHAPAIGLTVISVASTKSARPERGLPTPY